VRKGEKKVGSKGKSFIAEKSSPKNNTKNVEKKKKHSGKKERGLT